MKKTGLILLSLIILLSGSLYWVLTDTANIETQLKQTAKLPELSITYFGTSTLLFDDGRTQIISDGFFTRPSLLQLITQQLQSDLSLLHYVIKAHGLQRLATIVPLHSHHDHVMDSAPLAELTEAVVLGSPTTAYIAQGWGLAQQQIQIADSNIPYTYDDFTLRLIPSRHVPMPTFLQKRIGMGEKLNAPLQQPARLSDYKEGISYSLHIQHPKGNYLIQGSANAIPHALNHLQADTVFLGVAGLSQQSEQYIHNYLQNTVAAVKATRVIPIHWESFAQPANNQLLPTAIDNIPGSLQTIKAWLDARDIAFEYLPVQSIDAAHDI